MEPRLHTHLGRLALSLAIALVLGLGWTTASSAQGITTGNLSGVVTDEEGTTPLPGAAIEIVHIPTGSRSSATSRDDGRFAILNLRPGGPYTLTVTLDGFKQSEITDIYVNLGEASSVNVGLQIASIAETVTVVGEVDPLINPNKTGSTSTVTSEELATLPSVRRSIQDFARLNPSFNVSADDPASSRISVAGRNNRYNQIQIDGAVNNDLFGLADTGTPGGQTDAQPINLDAIEQIQLVVSPYDVRQGGFTGGGINAITRSGTNAFSGSLYASSRDQDYIGDGPFDTPVAEFGDDQVGFRLGGRIIRDKMFFFASAEQNRRDQPTGVSADGSTGQQFRNPAQAQAVKDILTSRYGYDPGSLGDFPGTTDSDQVFLRLDFNLNDSHKATLRHNYVDATRDVIADRSSTAFRFPTAIYAQANETNSSVFQLNSVFGTSFNEARLGFQTVRDARAPGVTFPSVDVGPISRRPEVAAGTERFSGANSLDQDVLEVTDDFTLVRGNHTLTIGTHNEFFDFSNVFLSDFYGFYRFNTVADLQRGVAQEYAITFGNGSVARRPAEFSVSQYGLYAGDQWQVNDKLTVIYGIRGDMSNIEDDPSFNPAVETAFGFRTNDVPSGDLTISPRIGFNWSPDGNQQIRGGVGLFLGRTPYVWISNAFGNTGIETTSLTATGSIPFNPDPFNQPRNLGSAPSTVSVDLVDPDFKYPQVMRATLGYDRELPWGIRGSAEVIYTQVQEDVFYTNENLRETGVAFDGRPTYTRINSRFGTAVQLTNTSKGDQLNASVRLDKRFNNGLSANVSYAYMDSNSAFDATSSRAISNWQFQVTKGDIFKDENARSVFEIENRVTASLAYGFNTGSLGHNVALFYNAQAGEPYSVLVGGDPNRDGFSTNDLLFVPANFSDVIFRSTTSTPITEAMWNGFLSSAGIEGYRGQIVDRNSSTEPWSRFLDFHYDIELPIKVIRTQLSFDILNLVNMLDSDSGVVKFVNFNTVTPVTFSGIDAASGKPIYTANPAALRDGSQFTTADIRSRWQAKLGLRISF